MGVNALIPVEEAFDVNLVAYLKGADCGVNVAIGSREIYLNAEAVSSVTLLNGNVYIVAGLIVFVLDTCDLQALEAYKLVLVLDELVLLGKEVGYVGSGCFPCAVGNDLKGSVDDLDLTCHSALVPLTLILVPFTSFSLSSSEQAIS